MPIMFPAYGKKSIAVFWASWCGPCGIELSRINKAILEKEIGADRIYAISLDQDLHALEKTILEKKYSFKTYLDKENTISTLLKVNSTPTIVFIDETGKVSWQTTGVSPFLINRIKSFLN
jgi:thiol-disulfide isomerase/thioredoxin